MNIIRKLLVLVLIFTMALSHLGIVRVNADDEEVLDTEEETKETSESEGAQEDAEGEIYEVEEEDPAEEDPQDNGSDEYTIDLIDDSEIT